MKLTYRFQITLSAILILVGNSLSTLSHHWVYRNIAFFLCGLIWIFHPVMPASKQPTERDLKHIRIAGVIVILIAVFTRVHT